MSRFHFPIRDFARGPLVGVSPDAPLPAVHALLEDRNISAVPVLDADGRGVGVVSRTDLLRLGRVGARTGGASRKLLVLPEKPVSEVMHAGVETCAPDATVARVAATMVDKRIHRVFVEKDGALEAVFGTRELMLAVHAERLTMPISEIMSLKPFTVPVDAKLSLATDRLAQAHTQGVVVVDADGWPVGVFTQREALFARELPQDGAVEGVMSHGLLCLHVSTPLFRAAAQAAETRARRVLAIDDKKVVGVVTGLDFARVARG